MDRIVSRAVVVMELGEDASRLASVLCWLAPRLDHLVVIGHLSRSWHHWFTPGPWHEMSSELHRGGQLMRELHERLMPLVGHREERLALEMTLSLSEDEVARLVSKHDADMVLLGPLPWTTAPLLSQWIESLLDDVHVPVVWLGSRVPETERPEHLLMATWQRAVDAKSFVSFLQSRTRAFSRLIGLDWSGHPHPRAEIESWHSLLGGHFSFELHVGEVGVIDAVERLSEAVELHEADLLVLNAEDALRSWQIPFLSRDALEHIGCPVLVLPPYTASFSPPLEVADGLLLPGGEALVLQLHAPSLLSSTPLPESVHVVVEGVHRCTLPVRKGQVVIPLEECERARPPAAVGLVRATSVVDEPTITSRDIDAYARVFRPDALRLCLFDPMLPRASLLALAALREEMPGLHFVGVTLQPALSFERLRKRLHLHQLGECYLFDGSLLLDDGGASDLPDELMGMKLGRVAYRLRAQGVQVAAIVGRHTRLLHGEGFAVLGSDVSDLQYDVAMSKISAFQTVDTAAKTLEQQLERLSFCGESLCAGNRVMLELDNREAREHLLRLCVDAKHQIHVQSYIVKADAFAEELAGVLEAAAARGVAIRILLDSLYSLHGSFGQHNEWVTRMEQVPGIEVRCFRPIDGFPGVEELKQRNHRKLILFDGHKGLVTGRNLAASYYTSFDEVPGLAGGVVSAKTPGSLIPWMDAGVFVEGPLMRLLEASFLRDWEAAGGASFALSNVVEEVGDVACRFVRHDGLVDAFTLEAQLALIRAATSHLIIVNTFPFHEEVLHALIQAIERGVRVSSLVGNVRPLYGTQRAAFPDSVLRDLATAVIHGRIDRLVQAGGEAYEYTIEKQIEGWAPELFPVFPHVHSKLLTCDGRYAAIGSANFDVTGSFWESEGLLVIQDRGVTHQLESALRAKMRPSGKIDIGDPEWQQRAQRRAWISRYWPSMLG